MTMDFEFSPVPFDEIREDVRRHLAALPGTIDSFLEDHILASSHYRIVIAGEAAGFASIHKERLITQFALAEPYRRCGQPVFARLRRWEQVQAAFVPTCDPYFLAHALDDYRLLEKQAYFFEAPIKAQWTASTRCRLRVAEPRDLKLIQDESGDFFAPIERFIEASALFVTLRGEEPVGFGLLEVSRIYEDVASVGMYTIERFRREGVGTETITLLMAECHGRGLRPVAGCWYYNHGSKRTLERVGMFAPTRLLRISY
jgi:RimJ/RimL family protein N-acetyltransferase